MVLLGALLLLASCGEQETETDVIDAGDGGASTCDPLEQTGCAKGRCTWLNAQDRPPLGLVTCASNGSLARGAACTAPPAGPMGYDDCVRGSICVAGTCRAICSVRAPSCDAGRACVTSADVFTDLPAVGTCEP